MRKYGKCEIFNTDQGSQYTRKDFTKVLTDNEIKISMDGKTRALDKNSIERLWCSVKYENIFLNEYKTMNELRTGIEKYFEFYNSEIFHPSLDYRTTDGVYFEKILIAVSCEFYLPLGVNIKEQIKENLIAVHTLKAV
jgi:putative transposase